jgi:hypothetical protein
MNPRPKVLFRSFIALLFLMVASSSLTLAQTTDSNQDQTYGVWKVPNPQTPGIQFRAKCNDDITDSQGRTKSEWSFQFRSTYKGAIDFIYLNEAGIAQPPANKMIGPFLETLKPGETYENGDELYGGCSQHATVTTGIHVTIKCAVPTGQDAPCFKDANGKPYPQAAAGGSQAGSVGASSGRTKPRSNGITKYWVCRATFFDGAHPDTLEGASQLFETSTPGPVTDDMQDKFSEEFIAFLLSKYAELSNRPPQYMQPERRWDTPCYMFDTKDEAAGRLAEFLNAKPMHLEGTVHRTPEDWPPATPTGPYRIHRVN